MIDSLISNPGIRMLEQTLSFTEQRHAVLLDDIANASTPGYVQKDLSVPEFQGALRAAIAGKQASNNGAYEPAGEAGGTVAFEPGGSRVYTRAAAAPRGVAFHDGGVRQMEYLMSEIADNAMAHNMAAQFLKGKYDTIGKAISMRV
jgi:flagellar basal-body rod protein FlgB